MKHKQVCTLTARLALGFISYPQASNKPLQVATRDPAIYAIVGSHFERAEAGNIATLDTVVSGEMKPEWTPAIVIADREVPEQQPCPVLEPFRHPTAIPSSVLRIEIIPDQKLRASTIEAR